MDMSTTPTLIRHQLYIDGRFVEPAGGQFFESDNPYTGEPWALIPRGNAEDVDRAVRAAHKALTSGPWPKLTATQRGALLRKLGDLVAANAKELAAAVVREQPRPVSGLEARVND